ncbi:MAG: 2-oxo acid dehydrogenase subunit E2 [Armatimonadetes bacterium]|nr:2-oxo acid dehydrogenase subunit E2 [Armatimonadota bacterium]
MAVDFVLPDLGEGIKAADVVKVLVKEGDTVAAGQTVLEVETDKAGLDVPCPVAGTVSKVLVKAGTKANVGAVMLVIEAGEAAATKPADPPAKAEALAAAVAAAAAIATAANATPEPAAAEAPAAPEPAKAAVSSDKTPVFASPSVRQFAREVGIDIRTVEGTGPGGRISVEDVKAAARNVGRLVPVAPAAGPDLPEFSRWGAIHVEPMNKVRRTAATYLSECWHTIPHVTIFDKCDVTALEAWRARLKPRADRAGVKITVTAILLKVLAKALKQFPKLNASLDIPGDQIVLKDHYHLGIAVDSERGLVVPVVRDVDRKSLFQVAKEMTDLADAGRRGKLAPNDMQGASFTLTNLGGLGIGYFTPVVPHPQVAILGVGRSVREPVWNEAAGAFEPRLMMPLSLSIDHRLVDGADGARFLRWIIDTVQEPLSLLEG